MNPKTLKSIMIVKAAIAALLLLTFALTAIHTIEVDFDQFLRFVSCVGFCFVAYNYWKSERKTDAVVAGLCGLIFNPFQHLDMFSTLGWRSFNIWFGLFVAVWAAADYLKLRKLNTATNQ